MDSEIVKRRVAELQKYTIELLRVSKLDFPIVGNIKVSEEDWSTHNELPCTRHNGFMQSWEDIPVASINHGCDVLVFGVSTRRTIKSGELGMQWDSPAVMLLTCACHGMDPDTGYWDEDWHVRDVYDKPTAAVTALISRLVEDVVSNNFAYPLEGQPDL